MTRKKSITIFGVCMIVILFAVSLGTVTAQTTLTDMEQLGQSIFFDTNLSLHENQSCATCHAPEAGWTGPDSIVNAGPAIYEGSVTGLFGNRKPPSSAYATLSPIFHMDKKGLFVGGNFWDGRATGEVLGNPAADQAQGPFLNPLEQALAAPADVVAKVCAASYGDLFKQVYGEAMCEPANVSEAYGDIALAIAAFEASPESNAFTSKFDLTFDGKVKLDKLEQRGYALFRGKGKCHLCHISNGKMALFTDFTFDNLGLPKNPENPFYYADPLYNPDGYDWVDPGLGGFLGSRDEYKDYAAEHMGMHKVPTLRNVDLRPGPDFVKAYGHNGYFKTLEGIVHFYNTRDVLPTCLDDYTEAQALASDCWPAPEVPENVNTVELGNLGLTPDEEAAIVAFLKTLSDGYQP
ncbi:MAG: cytochrome C [Chloroflexota bacterium]|nr:MAG: cytochrome C [Chloroflexota bacterium]